jgi:uncharacterized protein
MPSPPAPFIGRSQELMDLKQLHSRSGSHIAVVYGRRRVGKTALINHAFEGELMLSFEGLENRGKKEQLRNFLFQIERQTSIRIARKTSIRSWREALIELLPAVRNKHAVLLLDELQWMANYRTDLIADLKMVWEQYLIKSARITLVLCGSVASFMERKVLKSKALYGRADLSIYLQPFKLADTRKLLASHSVEDVLLAQLIVGGVPKYLNLLYDYPSIAVGMDQLAFSKNGFFNDEFERIFVSHFGKSEIYDRIIDLLAKNPGGLSRAEIQQRLDLPAGGELTRNLYNMESAGFIAALTPFDHPASAQLARYIIEDLFMRFYFAFLLPYKRKKAQREHYFTNLIFPSARFSSWLRRSFELLCPAPRAGRASAGVLGDRLLGGPVFPKE